MTAADPLPDRGEDVEEHEHEQERLDQDAEDELDDVLAEHEEVAADESGESRAAGGKGAPERLAADAGEDIGGLHRLAGGVAGRRYADGGHSRSSFPVKLMKTVSSVVSDTDRSCTT